VLTGASTGLGLSLARLFIEAGDTVYGTSRTQKNWKKAKHSLPSKNFHLAQIDGTSEAKVKRFLSQTKKKAKRIDILINNSGYAAQPARLEKHSLKEFEKNISQNLLSSFVLSKFIIPIFRKQKKGILINISSMAGVRAVPRLSLYSASKFGVMALTQAIAKENLDIPLKCITVSPGGMNTEMRAKVFGKKDASKQQSSSFVAEQIFKIAQNKIKLRTGENIIIRHGKIAGIQSLPGA